MGYKGYLPTSQVSLTLQVGPAGREAVKGSGLGQRPAGSPAQPQLPVGLISAFALLVGQWVVLGIGGAVQDEYERIV